MAKFKVLQKDDGYAVYRYNALSGDYQLHFPQNDRVLSEDEANEYCESCNNLAREENEIPADEEHFKPAAADIMPNSGDTTWRTGRIIFIIFTSILAIITVCAIIKLCDKPSSNPSQYSEESRSSNPSQSKDEMTYEEFVQSVSEQAYDDGYTWAWSVSAGPTSKSNQKEAAKTYFEMDLGAPRTEAQLRVFNEIYLPQFYRGCRDGWAN